VIISCYIVGISRIEVKKLNRQGGLRDSYAAYGPVVLFLRNDQIGPTLYGKRPT